MIYLPDWSDMIDASYITAGEMSNTVYTRGMEFYRLNLNTLVDGRHN